MGKNSHFFEFFFCFNFAECRALGKGFAECPTKDTRQRRLCRLIFYRVVFAECKLGFAECPWHSANSLSPVVKFSWLLRSIVTCNDMKYFQLKTSPFFTDAVMIMIWNNKKLISAIFRRACLCMRYITSEKFKPCHSSLFFCFLLSVSANIINESQRSPIDADMVNNSRTCWDIIKRVKVLHTEKCSTYKEARSACASCPLVFTRACMYMALESNLKVKYVSLPRAPSYEQYIFFGRPTTQNLK